MKFVLKIFICLVSFTMLGAIHAADVKVGEIMITDPYIRALPASSQVTSGYLELHNEGHDTDHLLSAQSRQASRIEIHEMRMEGEVMRMRLLPDGLELPKGETVSLKPGGYHLMIFDPANPLLPGETFPIELQFAKTGTISIDFEIKDIDNKKKDDSDAGHHHHKH